MRLGHTVTPPKELENDNCDSQTCSKLTALQEYNLLKIRFDKLKKIKS